MKINDLLTLSAPLPDLFRVVISDKFSVMVYPRSLIEFQQALFFIARTPQEKYLFIASRKDRTDVMKKFSGTEETAMEEYHLKKCPLDHANAMAIQKIFPFTRPQLIGLQNSFGFGDRLGLANAGHLKALAGSGFKPVLAQQSIRELTRTRRQPEEVMDAAIWAVLQEGYRDGFGADADHLKTTEDIDCMVKAGFTMFTIDPGDQVDNQADLLDSQELQRRIAQLNWEVLDDSIAFMEKRYPGKKIEISKNLVLKPTRLELFRALVKYGKALVHIKTMSGHLRNCYPDYPSEIEVSVDETESVTSPFEHFFIASELNRLKIEFVSLAPRFIGSFEKGIDYRGDVDVFRREYEKHLQISRYFGTYKLSLHSGSDKFTVYRIIGSFQEGSIHVKTAGTSYLEALKVMAAKEPDFFRHILDFSRGLYETEKKSYHVSAELTRVHPGNEYSNNELLDLFTAEDARQVLHVTFGRVLTEKGEDGRYLFRDQLLGLLRKYEGTYDQFLVQHFKKHLQPFQ